MSLEYAFETFGISGIVLFGIGAITYKLYQKYIFSIASRDLLYKYNPQDTLNEAWENGNKIGNDHWHIGEGKYAMKETINGKSVWKIDIPQDENGDVFIYMGTSDKPEYNEKNRHFFRIKFRNLNDNTTDVTYQKKCFYGKRHEHIAANEKPISKERIVGNGVHYWEPISYIGEEEGDGEDKRTITKEQLGVYIRQIHGREVKNLIIEEAYIGKKCWKINLLPYISNLFYLIVEPRKVEVD
jgi:hypothetical protein